MIYQQLAVNQGQKLVEGYRGALVYRQEYGYKLITMMIDLYTPDERSCVISKERPRMDSRGGVVILYPTKSYNICCW